MRMILKRGLFIFLLAAFEVSCIHLYAQPVAPILRLETGMHNARSNSLSVDAAGQYLLSCSADKTARLWDAATGKLLSTLRIPIGSGEEGDLYACALDTKNNRAALGGWTTGNWEPTECIYILNPFTGVISKRLRGLPNVVNCLAFSADGNWLAAGLGDSGVRLYNTHSWQVKELSEGFDGPVTGLSFSKDGNLACVSRDGYLRLYSAGNFSLLLQTNSLAGNQPFSVAFNPAGNLLAVGYDKSPAVDVFTTADLALAYRPDVSGIPENQDVSAVSFSSDGAALYAGGAFTNLVADGGNKYVVRKWSEAGKGSFRDVAFLNNTVISIKPLPEGKMALLGTNPDIAELEPDNDVRWLKTAQNINFAAEGPAGLMVSSAGDVIKIKSYPKDVSFTISNRSVADNNALLYPPVTGSNALQLSGWQGGEAPAVNNVPLGFLADNETCRAACLCSDGTRIAWGGDYYLYLTDATGRLLWKQALPEAAFAVNISGDGKLIIAALGDGTIRWYNVTTGSELLALYMSSDHNRWILFTPKGYYDASAGAEDWLGWHLNNGPDKAPSFYPASRFKSTYYRPDIIDAILGSRNENTAVTEAGAGNTKRPVDTISAHHLPPIITISSPNSGAVISADTVLIHYNVQSPDAPVGSIKVLIDNRPVTGQRGMHVTDDKADNTIAVLLPEKSCTVTLIAENSNGISPAVNVYLTRNVPGRAVISDKPKLYILAIGISDYINPNYKLNYAADDAKSFADVFAKQKTIEYSDVIVKLITDKDATREKIQDALEWIQDTTTSSDIAMIFYAGHGVNDNNGYFYMAPVGADVKSLRSTCLNFRDLTQTVSAITGKVIVFIDACHSGDVTGGRGSFGDINSAVNDLSGVQNGAVVFTSSMGREFSLENPDWKHGAFTKALLDGIGKGEAAIKGKNTITVKSLDLYISQKVGELTGNQQHPTTVVPPNIPDFTIAVFNQ